MAHDHRLRTRRIRAGALRPSARRFGELDSPPRKKLHNVSVRYNECLAETGIDPSVGSKGGSYDNVLAETIIGLYKAEVIHRRQPPRKSMESVELGTIEWVSWFNHQRLMRRLGYIPPAEVEATITGNSTIRPPSQPDLNQPASANTRGGSEHIKCPAYSGARS